MTSTATTTHPPAQPASPGAAYGGFAPPAIANEPPPTRASDPDRERTIELLREHWLAGRLTLPEFEQRSQATTQATYVAELWQAVRELPVAMPAAASPAAKPASNDGSVAALVLGIVGMSLLVLSIGFVCFLSLPLSAAAWRTGRGARRRADAVGAPRGAASGGEVLGAIGTGLGGLALVGWGAVLIASLLGA